MLSDLLYFPYLYYRTLRIPNEMAIHYACFIAKKGRSCKKNIVWLWVYRILKNKHKKSIKS